MAKTSNNTDRKRLIARRSQLKSLHGQRGLGLVELSIAIAILSVVVVIGIVNFIDFAARSKAENQGELLKGYAAALDEYINQTTPILAAGDPVGNPNQTAVINGVNVTIYHPTFAQLVSLGLLDNLGQNLNLYGGSYLFVVRKLNPGCAPAVDVFCKVDGMVALSGPVTDFAGNPDYALAGIVAQKAGDAGVTGLASLGKDPEVVYGPQESWQFPHPGANGTPATIAASVGVRVNNGLGALTQYLRRDGTSFMTGPVQMRDVSQPESVAPRQNIVGAGAIDANSITLQQDVQAQNATISDTLTARNLAIANDISANNLSATNNVSAGNNVTAGNDVVATKDVVAQNNLLVTGGADVGGNLAASDIYLASKGIWLSQAVSDFVVVETRLLDLSQPNGGLVTKPTCPAKTDTAGGISRTGNAGSPRIFAWPVKGDIGSATDVRATVIPGTPDQVVIDNSRLAVGKLNIDAQDLGSQWLIQSTGLIDADGTNYASGFSVLAQVVCKYN